MTIDAIKQLEQQMDALIDYCKTLQQENKQLAEYNRTMTDKLQNILAQFQAVAEPKVPGVTHD